MITQQHYYSIFFTYTEAVRRAEPPFVRWKYEERTARAIFSCPCLPGWRPLSQLFACWRTWAFFQDRSRKPTFSILNNFGRFWEANMAPTNVFWDVCFVWVLVFRARFGYRFWDDFWVETSKITVFLKATNDCCKLDVFEQCSKNHLLGNDVRK